MKRRNFLAAMLAAPFSTLAAVQPPAPGVNAGDASKLAKRIARRYRIAPVAAALVVETAQAVYPEDPALLVALACVESSLQPFSIGGHGELGLTQVQPELHGFAPVLLIDPRGSLAAGAHVLRACIQRAGGDVKRGLSLYNGTGEAAQLYSARVIRERLGLVA